MPLRDPVAVYNAANNPEIYLVQNALEAAGIESHVTEDNTMMGFSNLGIISNIHKPQVWVDRDDLDRAKPVLDEFERRKAELATKSADLVVIELAVHCEECEKVTAFPRSQAGSVQECPHCHAYMDVLDESVSDEWAEAEFDEADGTD